MKTLYISDLDGTLLNSNQRLSAYTTRILKRLLDSRHMFSYATARSLVTAKKVTEGLSFSFPVICYNGAFIMDNATNNFLLETYFEPSDIHLLSTFLSANNVYPIVYAMIDGTEYFSFIPKFVNNGMRHFLDSRTGDPRWREVNDEEELYTGKVFYISCINSDAALLPVIQRFQSDKNYQCIASRDIYSNEPWCELLPFEATKANAVRRLKEMLCCDKLIGFGDNINDLPLFEVCDECYAVANAKPEVKAKATDVIGSNDEDGVAKWLEANVL